jgi:stage II sporulation protein D
MEVQKAFAIIVRSYSICSLGGRHFGSYNFDICNTTCCQVYRGRYRVNDNVIIAVNETGYKVITSGGRAVSAAYYSAIHGGESTNAAFVWGGSNPPHIAAQKTP